MMKLSRPNIIILILLVTVSLAGVVAIFTWRQTAIRNEVTANVNRISMSVAQNATTMLNTSFSIQHNLRLISYLHILTSKSWNSPLELIEFQETEIRSIERMINTNPLLQNIRIYIDQRDMLEFIPVVYNMARAGNSTWVNSDSDDQLRWYFDYADISTNNPIHYSEENLVASISSLRINNYLVKLEVASTMDDFVPGLFSQVDENNILVFVDMHGDLHYNEESQWGIEPSQIYSRIDFGDGFQIWNGVISRFNVLITYMPIENPFVGSIVEIRNITAYSNTTLVFSTAFVVVVFSIGYLFFKMSNSESLKKEIVVKDAQILALNNQIDSHFLYNTLETIKMLAEIEGNYGVSDTITSLGKMFRYNLGRNTTGEATLGQELNYVKEYMALTNLRFEKKIKLSIDVYDSLLDTIIPRMTLQPVVENCILHGKKDEILISISVHIIASNILIEVKDNGIGIDPDTLEKLQDTLRTGKSDGSFGLGLLNMRQRLILHHGKNCSVAIKSVAGFFTSVLITLGGDV